jgi:uncharacterized protein YjbI with pentapeptide repeats
MFSTAVIAVAGLFLLIVTIIPGVRLYWPQHRDPVSRSDLGIALMTGAVIAFAILALQVLIQIRSQRDANERERQSERAALLLQLGRSKNLAGLDLHRKDLADAYLNRKNLRGANLEQAMMTDASLQGSILIGANLNGASIDRARLDRADLRYADLGGASLVRAQLTGANLDSAALSPGVDLSHANLSNASLRADLRRAQLAGATLVGARMAPANLEGADLSDADLRYADLRGANLRGANLADAANLDQAKDLSLARFDGSTHWPPRFTWPPTKDERPTCPKGTCTLSMNTFAVHDYPPELRAMRKKLADAIAAPRCLPGWVIEDRPFEIQAYAPQHRASFHLSTAVVGGTSVKAWAQSFRPRNARPIPSITADGADRRPAYAIRAAHTENGRPHEDVDVWFIRRGRGFRLWGTSTPELFLLFQRDFIRIFGAMGVEGNLFPSLRGDKDPCGT